MVCAINHTPLFLGEGDLFDVLQKVKDLAPRWWSLGLALRLTAAKLETINSKNHTNPEECLKEMLLTWLNQCYNVRRFGPPSWKMLCQATFNPAGGNNPALARRIADGYH